MSAVRPETAGRFPDRNKVNEFLLIKNWNETPLGPARDWPQSLQLAIGFCLNSELPIAIWWGKELSSIYNESFRDLFGLHQWIGLGSSGAELLNRFSIAQTIQRVFQEGVAIAQTEEFMNDRGGKILSFYNSPIYEASGKVGGILTTVVQNALQVDRVNNQMSKKKTVAKTNSAQTVCEEKAVEEQYEELKRSDERYTKMIEEVEDYAIILLDVNGTILNWNKGAQKIKGYTEEEIIGRNFSIFYLDDDRARQLPQTLIQTAIKEGRAYHEGFRKRRDNTKFWGSVVITALHDERGEVIGFTKVTRDLTERKAAEDLIRQNASELEVKNKQLEQFAYIASHDLQEPLRKIQTFVQILEKKFDDKEIRQRYFEKINSSAKRMAELIQSVLHYSRLAQPNELVTRIDLNEVMESVLGDFEVAIAEKNAEVEYDSLPDVAGIRPQLGQLFANLVGNSLKFTREKPKIKISWRAMSGADARQQFPGADPNNEYIEIRFSDNGIGFEQQYAERIFSIFQRLNTRDEFAGTGIGLALSKKIIENHFGHIAAKSDLGKGATFFIFLPYK